MCVDGQLHQDGWTAQSMRSVEFVNDLFCFTSCIMLYFLYPRKGKLRLLGMATTYVNLNCELLVKTAIEDKNILNWRLWSSQMFRGFETNSFKKRKKWNIFLWRKIKVKIILHWLQNIRWSLTFKVFETVWINVDVIHLLRDRF